MVIGIALIAGVCFNWRSIHIQFLIYRIKHSVEWKAEGPDDFDFSGVWTFCRQISPKDPPDYVLDALWKVSIAPTSSREEAVTAGLALGCLAADDYNYFVKEGQTEKDWRDAMERFFDRWHPAPAPGIPSVEANFRKFEAEWRQKHP
ncbi:MAG: hypothetical protein Q8M07_07975 [Prosthecobacter sp.]|nr:hypothetical protein [Prosthecobacter sp.]